MVAVQFCRGGVHTGVFPREAKRTFHSATYAAGPHVDKFRCVAL
jgi:hypothetical protein